MKETFREGETALFSKIERITPKKKKKMKEAIHRLLEKLSLEDLESDVIKNQ